MPKHFGAPDRFNLDDFREGLKSLRSLNKGDLLARLPNLSFTKTGFQGKLGRLQGIVDAMTPDERRHPKLLADDTRRRRIAEGGGATSQEVECLVGQFDESCVLVGELPGIRGLRLMIELAEK